LIGQVGANFKTSSAQSSSGSFNDTTVFLRSQDNSASAPSKNTSFNDTQAQSLHDGSSSVSLNNTHFNDANALSDSHNISTPFPELSISDTASHANAANDTNDDDSSFDSFQSIMELSNKSSPRKSTLDSGKYIDPAPPSQVAIYCRWCLFKRARLTKLRHLRTYRRLSC
jgi:hypothetical protein